MIDDPNRILIVEARYYAALSDELLKGAKRALEQAGAEWNVVSVPGALEIPGAISLADESTHRPAGIAYDGYIALGVVIRGETYHFEVVSNESARGLTDLAIGRKICIGNGILTVENEAQAWARANIDEGDKGGFAARACLQMIGLKKQLSGLAR